MRQRKNKFLLFCRQTQFKNTSHLRTELEDYAMSVFRNDINKCERQYKKILHLLKTFDENHKIISMFKKQNK